MCVCVCVRCVLQRGRAEHQCVCPGCDVVCRAVIFSSVASLPLLLTDSIQSVGTLSGIAGIPNLHRAMASARLGD